MNSRAPPRANNATASITTPNSASRTHKPTTTLNDALRAPHRTSIRIDDHTTITITIITVIKTPPIGTTTMARRLMALLRLLLTTAAIRTAITGIAVRRALRTLPRTPSVAVLTTAAA